MTATFFELATHLEHDGVNIVNTHHFLQPDVEHGEPADLANAWYNALRIIYVAMQPGEYSLVSVSVREILPHNQTQPPAYVLPVGLAGSRDADGRIVGPTWLCARATIFSNRPGRRWRGANMFAGVAMDDFREDAWYTAADDNFKGACEFYLAAMLERFGLTEGEGDYVWVNFSRFSWKSEFDTPDWTAPVISSVVRSDVRGDRRRR